MKLITRKEQIEMIRTFPTQLRQYVAALTAEELTATPIAGEWSIAQNVHHIADSHMNSYIRCKLMATEEQPPLKPYDEGAWAQFPDAVRPDLEGTLMLLTALHERWAIFWEHLGEDDWGRTGEHLTDGAVTLAQQLRGYVRHGEAHLEQIERNLAAQRDL